MKSQTEITSVHFEDRVGRKPELDDLERVNCKHAGEFPNHQSCGWCTTCDLPRFMCGNRLHDTTPTDTDTITLSFSFGEDKVDLASYEQAVRELRTTLLCCSDPDKVLSPMATQHFLLALGALEQAADSFQDVALIRTRENVSCVYIRTRTSRALGNKKINLVLFNKK